MWKDVERGRPQMIKRCMRIACCITKDKNTNKHTHTSCVMLMAIRLNYGGTNVSQWNVTRTSPLLFNFQLALFDHSAELMRYTTLRRWEGGYRFLTLYVITINKRGNVRVTWHWGAFVPPLLQWKINEHYITWVCISGPRYPACNAHAPYCHPWSAPLHNIFTHYFIKGTIFGKKNIEHKMCVFIFSVIFVWNIFNYKKNLARYDRKCILVFV